MPLILERRFQPAETSSRPGSTALLSCIGPLAVIVVTVLLYKQVSLELFSDWWTQPDLSQGLLIVPFALYIAYLRRGVTLQQPAAPDSRGLLVVGSGCLLYLLGIAAAEFFLSRMSLLLLLTGFIWTFWGTARLRTLVFPLVLLVSAIPLPAIVYNTATAPLQLLASELGTNLAQMFGVTVYRDGNVINLAHMSLGVEEACSGLNSLSAMFAGAILVGFISCTRGISRLLILFTSLPIAIAANAFRVGCTAIFADYNQQFAEGFYHALSGWLIFLIGFAGLFGVSTLLAHLERRLTNK